jgi:hypothetical protein
MTFSILSCFLHIQAVVFKPPDKFVILSGERLADLSRKQHLAARRSKSLYLFRSFHVFCIFNQLYSSPHKIVILSVVEEPRAANRPMLLGACDFFDLFVFSAYSTSCIQPPDKAVILSGAPDRWIP